MKQKKISYWLKGLAIVLAVMGILLFAALTGYAFYLKSENPGNPRWGFVFFSWFTAVFCYAILIEFWKVCTEIGKDNSFSLENTAAFHHMGLCGIAVAAGFLVRMIWIFAIGQMNLLNAVFIICEIILSGVFTVLCEALSKLIQNAYEVKRENELTI